MCGKDEDYVFKCGNMLKNHNGLHMLEGYPWTHTINKKK
jgi:hypothetical protein